MIGESTQLDTILLSDSRSVGDPVKIFQPMIPPITACDVETGSLIFVIAVTEIPTARATEKLPASALIEPSSLIVFVVPAPLITEPSTTKSPPMIAAVRNFTIFETTAVPNTFTA
jgi:hypothetical protein